MPKFTVTCEWRMCGTFEVEAPSALEARLIVENGEGAYKGLPDGEYMDDSFSVTDVD